MMDRETVEAEMKRLVPEAIPEQTRAALQILDSGRPAEAYLLAVAGENTAQNTTIGTLSSSSTLLLRATCGVRALCEANTTDEEILALISERSREAREAYYREMDRGES